MEIVYIVLNKPSYLKEILAEFLEYDIHGATVIDSQGMGHLIAGQTPMFSMFTDLKYGTGDHSKMIFTVVNDDNERDRVLEALENVLGDISEPDSAVLFTTPVGFQKGMNLE